MGHSRLSGSKVHTWTKCPGMIPASESLRIEEKTNPAASLGTSAHFLAETCLREYKKPKDYLWQYVVAEKSDDDGDKERKIITSLPVVGSPEDLYRISHVIDHDMVNAVTIYVNLVNDLIRKTDDCALMLEKKSNPLSHRNDMGGTCDAVIYNDKVMYVIDYKHGSGVYVDIKSNGQLLSYLLGVARETGFIQDKYVYVVVQPRYLYNIEGRRVPALNLKKKNYGIRYEEINKNQLLKWSNWLNKRAIDVDMATFDLIKNNNEITEEWSEKYFNAGEHCRFCPVKKHCSPYRKLHGGEEW